VVLINSSLLTVTLVGRVAQSVYRLATGLTVQGSNPGGDEIFRTCPDRPWGLPSLLYNGTGSFPVVESGQGVTLTPYALLVPRSKIQSRGIPLLCLRAFVACENGETYLTITLHYSGMVGITLFTGHEDT
jgi:hypothetical protein